MKPLEGVTVVELARVLACPFATMILAELGAKVIKIEQPGDGDETRGYEPYDPGPARGEETGSDTAISRERSAYFFACNRSKQSVTVNIRDPDGQDIVRALLSDADIFIENFPKGSLARYRLDWPSLEPTHPRLLHISCTGFGQVGPMSHRKGYDTVFQAMGGLMSLTGERGGGPVKPGLPIADLSSGLWIAIAALSMLQGRGAGGRGGHLDFSMLDGQISLLTLAAARYFALGEVPERIGTEHPGRVPSASFRCRDEAFVHITGADQHWRPLCTLLGLSEWGADPRFATNSGRVRHRAEVMRTLDTAIAALTSTELCELCDAAGVPAGPIRTIDTVLADEHVAVRGLRRTFDHPEAGRFDGLALPFRFDGFDSPDFARPPLLGEHTEAVLAGQLGLDETAIARLRQKGAI